MKKAILALSVVAILCGPTMAATKWWDQNGNTAGAGATPNGTWDQGTTSSWNTSSAGTNAPTIWVAGDSARMAAGTDAANPYTVTVSGTVDVLQIGLEEAAAVTFNGGIINFTHAAAATSILTGVTTGIPTTATINSQISSTAGVGFKIARNLGLTNIVTISNTANNWTGTTAINGDNTLRLGASGVIPDTSPVTIAVGTAAGSLNVNGMTETIKTISTSSATPTVVLGSGSLTVADPAGEVFAGVISGVGSFTKNGAGTFTLSGANTYTGGTTIGGGVLQVGNGGTVGNLANGAAATAPIAINGGSILRFNRSDVITHNLSGVISGNGSIEKLGANTIRLNNGSNTYSGSTTITSGGIEVDGDATLGNGAGNLNLAGGRLNATATRTVATSNPINVTANSEITTTSTAASAEFEFSSNTVGGNGTSTLTFRNDGADAATDTFKPRFSGSGFNFANPIALANGVLNSKTELNSFNSGATIQTFSGEISGNGSYRRSASSPGTGGTTVFTAANTYSGGTVVNDGTLLVNNTTGSGTGSGDVTVNSNGTLGGNGTISGSVIVNGGVVGPGTSIGSITTGSLLLNSGTYDFEFSFGGGTIADNAVVLGADLWNVNGQLTILNAVTLVGTDLGTVAAIASTKFTVFTYTSAGTPSGSNFRFGNALFDDSQITLDGVDFVINYDDTVAGLNAVTLTVAAVPEASTFLTIGLGGIFAIAAVWMGRRMGVNVLKV